MAPLNLLIFALSESPSAKLISSDFAKVSPYRIRNFDLTNDSSFFSSVNQHRENNLSNATGIVWLPQLTESPLTIVLNSFFFMLVIVSPRKMSQLLSNNFETRIPHRYFSFAYKSRCHGHSTPRWKWASRNEISSDKQRSKKVLWRLLRW